MKRSPLVSIVSIAYNQEKYIGEALESFVTQKTNFDFEIIIADDCSTDSTPTIIQSYCQKYPHLFKPILRTKNIGVQKNLIDAMRAASGTYIALCEGDDYWTDPEKLQLQVNFLEKHTGYALCFHAVRVFYENNEKPEYIFPTITDRTQFTANSLLKSNFIQTNSVMYRRQSYEVMPEDMILPLDWYFHLYHALFGEIGYIDTVMSAYRRHPGGIWWESANHMEVIWKKYDLAHIAFYNEIRKLYGDKAGFADTFNESIELMFKSILEADRTLHNQLLLRAIQKYPELAEVFIKKLSQELKSALHTIEVNNQASAQLVNEKTVMIESRIQEVKAIQIEKEKIERQLDSLVHSKTYKAAQKVVAPYRKLRTITKK